MIEFKKHCTCKGVVIYVLNMAFLVCSFIFSSTDICNADNNLILSEMIKLEERITQEKESIVDLEEKIAQQNPKTKEVEPTETIVEDFDKHTDSHLLHREEGHRLPGGLRMGIGTTIVLQNAHNANADNLSQQGKDEADSSYSVDLEFEKKFGGYGKAFIKIEAGGGVGVEDELKVFSNVNRDADDNGDVGVTEAWYEHNLSVIPLTLTIGRIDATIYIDNNEYTSSETTQFLGRIFRNSPTIETADNAAGIRFCLKPKDFIDLELVALDADDGWENMFDETFFAAQLNFKPELFTRSGNYRFLGWINDRNHTKWLDTTKTGEKGFGFGISFDQKLTNNLGAFMRYGWKNPQVHLNGDDFSLEHTWSSGIQLSGDIWNREGDVLGLAYGLIFPPDEYKRAQNRAAKSEGHLELYYRYKINDHLSLSPDLQVVWRPYGRDAAMGTEAITVFGLRGQVDF